VRKLLVISQFVITIGLVIGTIFVSNQIHYIQNKDLGLDKEHLIWFPSNIPSEKSELAMEAIRQIPGVKSIGQSSVSFTLSNNRDSDVKWPGKVEGNDVFFSFIAASHDLIETMGIELKAGRNFSKSYVQDTGSYILNEEAVRQMGLVDPIGKTIETYGGKGTIVGITKDFHFESLHQPINPVIFICRPEWTWLMYFRAEGQDIQKIIQEVEKVYHTMAPGFVFDYNFQDKEYDRIYRSENQISTLVKWFSGLAMLISFLGLFGLTLFSMDRKAKEIGIRKVLGASMNSIMLTISKPFMSLVLTAALLTVLPTYYFTSRWLQNFAYRSDLDWWVFGEVILVSVLLAGILVVVFSYRYLQTNPTKILKTE
jgi:putative ABC transport system permease protein